MEAHLQHSHQLLLWFLLLLLGICRWSVNPAEWHPGPRRRRSLPGCEGVWSGSSPMDTEGGHCEGCTECTLYLEIQTNNRDAALLKQTGQQLRRVDKNLLVSISIWIFLEDKFNSVMCTVQLGSLFCYFQCFLSCLFSPLGFSCWSPSAFVPLHSCVLLTKFQLQFRKGISGLPQLRLV